MKINERGRGSKHRRERRLRPRGDFCLLFFLCYSSLGLAFVSFEDGQKADVECKCLDCAGFPRLPFGVIQQDCLLGLLAAWRIRSTVFR